MKPEEIHEMFKAGAMHVPIAVFNELVDAETYAVEHDANEVREIKDDIMDDIYDIEDDEL